MDFQFFMEPPELFPQGELEIAALTPLSLVPSQPGIYYRSHQAPTEWMLMGMLENVMGWHFSLDMRKRMMKGLSKTAKKAQGRNSVWKDHPWLSGKAQSAESGYISLLQYHVEITGLYEPSGLSYDDLWSQHLRDDGGNFVGGSRNYDYRLEGLIERSKTKEDRSDEKTKWVEFGDRAEHQAFDSLEKLIKQEKGKIKAKSIHPYFPRYYVSPKVRGYVIPDGSYRYQVKSTPRLAGLLAESINQASVPVYLGSNDGWVTLNWKNHE